jgi:hypothetical protein
MPSRSLPIEQVLTLLAETPSHITEFTVGLTQDQLHAAPSPGEWSVIEVLAHLRSCADVWGDCIAAILTEDRPTVRAINPRTWVKSTNYPELEFHPSFQVFTKQREELLAVLESLAPEDWLRGATVTGAGKPLERTVQFYAQWLAKHERSHLKQFKRIQNMMRK